MIDPASLSEMRSAHRSGVWVDGAGHRLFSGMTEIKLTPFEWAMFDLMYQRSPHPVAYEDLQAKVYGAFGEWAKSNSVLVVLGRLKVKFEGTRLEMENVWGEGYRLVTKYKVRGDAA